MCGSIIHQSRHKARKHQRCELCEGPIHPGEEYERQVIADGGLSTWLSHVECLADAVRLMPTEDDGCWFGSLWSFVVDSGEPLRNHDLSPAVAARIERGMEEAQGRRQLWLTDLYANTYPNGRWADDGGPVAAEH